MQWSEHFDRNGLNGSEHDPRNDNQTVVIHALLVFAVCFYVSSHLPGDLVIASLSSLLLFGGLGFMVAASYRGEPLFGEGLSRWDVAAIFIMASIVLSSQIDPNAVMATLEANGAIQRSPPDDNP